MPVPNRAKVRPVTKSFANRAHKNQSVNHILSSSFFPTIRRIRQRSLYLLQTRKLPKKGNGVFRTASLCSRSVLIFSELPVEKFTCVITDGAYFPLTQAPGHSVCI